MRTRQAVFSSLARERAAIPAPLRSRLVQCDSLIGFLSQKSELGSRSSLPHHFHQCDHEGRKIIGRSARDNVPVDYYLLIDVDTARVLHIILDGMEACHLAAFDQGFSLR